MTVNITQETANLVNTLANAASQIGSTAASAKINQLIVDLLPGTTDLNELVESLRLDNEVLQEANDQLKIDVNAYRISNEMRGENLEVMRSAMEQITKIADQAVAESASAPDDELVNSLVGDLRQIIALSSQDPQQEPIEA